MVLSRCLRTPRVIRVASDFSGLGTVGIAMARMFPNNKYAIKFYSDTNPKSRSLAQLAEKKPDRFYRDVLKRDLDKVPESDVYVWTPPCQSYSRAGKRMGTKDPRGNLTAIGVKYVVKKKPRVAIMEMVKGMADKKHKHVIKGINKSLKKVGYTVKWKVLSADHYQTAQERERLIMCAIQGPKRAFSWPAPVTPRVKLNHILDPFDPTTDTAGGMPKSLRQKGLMQDACDAARKIGVDPKTTPIAIDIDCGRNYKVWGNNVAKTLTKSRGQSGGPWISSRGRRTTPTELLKVMGFGSQDIPWEAAGISKSKLGEMLGDAVPLPMLSHVMAEAMYSAGVVVTKPVFPAFQFPA